MRDPAALGGAFQALAAHDRGEATKADLGRVKVHGGPSEVEHFTAPRTV